MMIFHIKKKTHDHVTRKNYFEKYFGKESIVTVFFFQNIILALNSFITEFESVLNLEIV